MRLVQYDARCQIRAIDSSCVALTLTPLWTQSGRQSKDHSLKSEEKLPTIPASPHIRLGDEWDDLTGWGSYAEVMIATRALGDPQETKKLRRLAIAFRDFDRDGDNLLSKAEMLVVTQSALPCDTMCLEV